MFKKGDVLQCNSCRRNMERSCLMFIRRCEAGTWQSAEIYGKSPSGLSGLSR